MAVTVTIPDPNYKELDLMHVVKHQPALLSPLEQQVVDFLDRYLPGDQLYFTTYSLPPNLFGVNIKTVLSGFQVHIQFQEIQTFVQVAFIKEEGRDEYLVRPEDLEKELLLRLGLSTGEPRRLARELPGASMAEQAGYIAENRVWAHANPRIFTDAVLRYPCAIHNLGHGEQLFAFEDGSYAGRWSLPVGKSFKEPLLLWDVLVADGDFFIDRNEEQRFQVPR